MRKRPYYILLIMTLLCFISCGVKSDAKKAANFTKQSIEKTVEQNFDEATKFYKAAEEIRKRYENSEKQIIFEKYYREFRDMDKKIKRD